MDFLSQFYWLWSRSGRPTLSPRTQKNVSIRYFPNLFHMF